MNSTHFSSIFGSLTFLFNVSIETQKALSTQMFKFEQQKNNPQKYTNVSHVCKTNSLNRKNGLYTTQYHTIQYLIIIDHSQTHF